VLLSQSGEEVVVRSCRTTTSPCDRQGKKKPIYVVYSIFPDSENLDNSPTFSLCRESENSRLFPWQWKKFSRHFPCQGKWKSPRFSLAV